jgi:hypothetical protein
MSVKPGFIVHHRSFQHHYLLYYKKNYSYIGEVRFDDTNSFTMQFFEFCGYRHTLVDVRVISDIYIDMTLDTYTLYTMISLKT